MPYQRVSYENLNSRQQEIYNFQKLAGVLADYGFNCIKLADDWQGADFLAYHIDGDTTLRVQLKGRLLIDKKYLGKKSSHCLSLRRLLAPHRTRQIGGLCRREL